MHTCTCLSEFLYLKDECHPLPPKQFLVNFHNKPCLSIILFQTAISKYLPLPFKRLWYKRHIQVWYNLNLKTLSMLILCMQKKIGCHERSRHPANININSPRYSKNMKDVSAPNNSICTITYTPWCLFVYHWHTKKVTSHS